MGCRHENEKELLLFGFLSKGFGEVVSFDGVIIR